MALAPLTEQQLAEAREWAGRLGVPEQAVIDDAQAAKDEGYRQAERAHHGHEAGWTERMAGVGNQMMPGGGPEPAELEAEAG
jgi:hypothetical protein